MLREGLEQLIFIGGNDQFFLAPLGGERGEVQRQPPIAPAVSLGRGLFDTCPAQDHLHPPQEDLHVEGLGHIVLGPHIKSAEHIALQVVGGEENHR